MAASKNIYKTGQSEVSMKWNKLGVSVIYTEVNVNLDNGELVHGASSMPIQIKKKNFADYICNVEAFNIVVSDTVLKRVKNIIEAQGFNIEIDEDWGFGWEYKIYCSK